MRKGWVWGLAAVAVGGGVFLVIRESGSIPQLRPELCSVAVGTTHAELDLEQARYASLIAATAVRRGLPARAASIAIATAYQESKVHNIDYGDRDSLGLFQQRPSQGWGTQKQVTRPRYAINTFYDALEKVDGYRAMEITEAAQRVQRSAYGGAYAEHEPYARALASALTGQSEAAFTCQVRPADVEPQVPGDNGLTPRANAVRRDVRKAYGRLDLGGFSPEGVSSGHSEGSAHYDGRAIDYLFRPVDEENLNDGWSLAQYLVANADRLAIATVIYDGRIWTARRSPDGWRDYSVPESATGDRAVLMHRDHVHVDVS